MKDIARRSIFSATHAPKNLCSLLIGDVKIILLLTVKPFFSVRSVATSTCKEGDLTFRLLSV